MNEENLCGMGKSENMVFLAQVLYGNVLKWSLDFGRFEIGGGLDLHFYSRYRSNVDIKMESNC